MSVTVIRFAFFWKVGQPGGEGIVERLMKRLSQWFLQKMVLAWLSTRVCRWREAVGGEVSRTRWWVECGNEGTKISGHISW